ncbi:MAG: TonB family protein [Synergistaceae bacterium]|jgi:protein TonB|nr:TonB family protein [Synergistaceae bacterium]
MIRFCVSVLLSALIHAALLTAVSLVPSRDAAEPPREVMRIALTRSAGPGPAESVPAAGAMRNEEPSPTQAQEAAPSPSKPSPETKPPEVESRPEPIDETRGANAWKKIEPPKPKPAEETPQPRAVKKTETPKPKPPKTANKTSEAKVVKKNEPAKPKSAPAVSVASKTVSVSASRFETSGSPGAPALRVAGPQQAPRGDAGSGISQALPGAVVDVERLRVTKRIAPVYPMISKKRRDQGSVVLLIKIVSGRVASTEIERGSGHAPLDESAERAVKGWQFDTSGYGAEVTARVRVSFKLK